MSILQISDSQIVNLMKVENKKEWAKMHEILPFVIKRSITRVSKMRRITVDQIVNIC